jgi:hypothetical protein
LTVSRPRIRIAAGVDCSRPSIQSRGHSQCPLPPAKRLKVKRAKESGANLGSRTARMDVLRTA